MDWQLAGSEEETVLNSLNPPRYEIYSRFVCAWVHVCQGSADTGFLKADF